MLRMSYMRILILSAAAILTAGYAHAAEIKTVTICGQAVVVPQEPVPDALRGVWGAQWDSRNAPCAGFVVNSVDQQNADVTYIHGQRRIALSGTYDGSNLLLRDAEGSTFLFTIQRDGVDAQFIGSSGRLSGHFERANTIGRAQVGEHNGPPQTSNSTLAEKPQPACVDRSVKRKMELEAAKREYITTMNSRPFVTGGTPQQIAGQGWGTQRWLNAIEQAKARYQALEGKQREEADAERDCFLAAKKRQEAQRREESARKAAEEQQRKGGATRELAERSERSAAQEDNNPFQSSDPLILHYAMTCSMLKIDDDPSLAKSEERMNRALDECKQHIAVTPRDKLRKEYVPMCIRIALKHPPSGMQYNEQTIRESCEKIAEKYAASAEPAPTRTPAQESKPYVPYYLQPGYQPAPSTSKQSQAASAGSVKSADKPRIPDAQLPDRTPKGHPGGEAELLSELPVWLDRWSCGIAAPC